MKKLIIIGMLLLTSLVSYAQYRIFSTEISSFTMQRVDTIGKYVYMVHEPYIQIITNRNGKPCQDTIINDTTNAIRFMIKEIKRLQYKLSLPTSFGFKSESDKLKFNNK